MELTRKQVIQRLVMMKSYAIGEDYESLEYAISFLKTDEAYQLMYEGVDVYDKDTVAWMFRELQLEIEKLDTYDIERTHGLIEDGYVTTDVSDIIQQKIDKLKENENGNDT